MSDNYITLAYGSGGEKYHQLVQKVFIPAFGNEILNELGDSAICPINGGKIAMTTDSFVVRPYFFPGGDIGRVAVCGTVNDLSVSGAKPLFLTVGMIIEAGFPIVELKKICRSMAEAAREAGVVIVTGDTKVVDKGECDGIFINTSGVGTIADNLCLTPSSIEAGDVIIVSGEIAAHGMAVMATRHNLGFENKIYSDVAPLNSLTTQILNVAGAVKLMRDPTRGGIASTLNEWAAVINRNIIIEEDAVPVGNDVRSACDLLGIDPFYVANEGKLLAVVAADRAEMILNIMRNHPQGANSAIIGRVTDKKGGAVYATNSIGGNRLIYTIEGDQLPRIC